MRVAVGDIGFWVFWCVGVVVGDGESVVLVVVVGRVGQRTLVTDHAKTSDAVMTVTALRGQTRDTTSISISKPPQPTSQKKRNGNKFPSPKLCYVFPRATVSLSEWVRHFGTLSTIRYIGYFSIKSPHSIFNVCKLPRETHTHTLCSALGIKKLR